jgi:hypothetical protein
VDDYQCPLKKISEKYIIYMYCSALVFSGLDFMVFCTGRLVEDMENKIRSTLNEIYFGKTRDIVNGLRSVQPLAEARKTKDLQVTEMLINFYIPDLCVSSFISSR